jgi:hypothetical protein
MPTNPLTAAQRHQKTGEWHRLQGISRPDIAIGPTTYVKARPCGGLAIIGKGGYRILLDRDEAAWLILVAEELTTLKDAAQ